MGDVRTTNWREEEFYRPMYEGGDTGTTWRDKLYMSDSQEPSIVPVKRASRGDRETTPTRGGDTPPRVNATTNKGRNKASLGSRLFRREDEEEVGGRDRHLAGFAKAKGAATNRAYKAYTQHETREKHWPSRSSSRMSYDTTGPLDERYYIREPLDGIGDKQKESVFMRLLHNEILNYDTRELSNGHRKLSNGDRKLSNGDRKLSNADQKQSNGEQKLSNGDFRHQTNGRKLSNTDKYMSDGERKTSDTKLLGNKISLDKNEKPSLIGKHSRKPTDSSISGKHSNSSSSGNCSPSHAKIATPNHIYNNNNNNNNNNKVYNRNNNNKVSSPSYVYSDSQSPETGDTSGNGLNSPGYINMSKSTSALLQPSIPYPDYDDPRIACQGLAAMESADRMNRLVNSLQRAHNRKAKEGDVWFNANRYRGLEESVTGAKVNRSPPGPPRDILKRSSSVDSHRSSKMSSPLEKIRKSPVRISPMRESFSRDARSPVREERASRSPLKESPSLPPVLESPLTRRGVAPLESTLVKKGVIPTKTLKVALKHRPPVSAFIQEIMKASEADRERQRDRLNLELEAIDTVEEMEKQEKQAVGDTENKKDSIDDDAQKIYKEILDVVKQNSPSLQSAQGRMVGYGGDKKYGKHNKLSQKGIHQNGHNLARIRLSEDRDSITTSLDSYPFSPTSPWGHAFPSRYNRFGYPVFPQRHFGIPAAGPVSFAGFSPSPSNLTSSSAGPASFQSELARKKKKKKKSWFNFF